MRLLVVDAFPEQTLVEHRGLVDEVDYRPGLKGPALSAALATVGILIVRSTPVTSAEIEAARALNLIIRAGAGVNTIDVKAASARGIYVANCPGKNATAVAELTMGLILA